MVKGTVQNKLFKINLFTKIQSFANTFLEFLYYKAVLYCFKKILTKFSIKENCGGFKDEIVQPSLLLTPNMFLIFKLLQLLLNQNSESS